jgi:site-specific recombinase XerD
MRNRLLVLWLYDTGCRLSEALTVPVASVDARAGTAEVYGKAQRARLVPLGAALRREVTRFLPKRPLYLHAQRREEDPGALFFDADGGPWLPRSAEK